MTLESVPPPAYFQAVRVPTTATTKEQPSNASTNVDIEANMTSSTNSPNGSRQQVPPTTPKPKFRGCFTLYNSIFILSSLISLSASGLCIATYQALANKLHSLGEDTDICKLLWGVIGLVALQFMILGGYHGNEFGPSQKPGNKGEQFWLINVVPFFIFIMVGCIWYLVGHFGE